MNFPKNDDLESNKEWVRSSINYIRRQTLEELDKRRRVWKKLAASQWSTWGRVLFLIGLVIVIVCLASLGVKLAYLDFYLYQLREDKQFIRSDLQKMLIEHSEQGNEMEASINYEPIIRRTCTSSNYKFIVSLILCCVATAFGFLLLCCGLSGITIEVEEKLDEDVINYLKSMYEREKSIISLYSSYLNSPTTPIDKKPLDTKNIPSPNQKTRNSHNPPINNTVSPIFAYEIKDKSKFDDQLDRLISPPPPYN